MKSDKARDLSMKPSAAPPTRALETKSSKKTYVVAIIYSRVALPSVIEVCNMSAIIRTIYIDFVP